MVSITILKVLSNTSNLFIFRYLSFGFCNILVYRTFGLSNHGIGLIGSNASQMDHNYLENNEYSEITSSQLKSESETDSYVTVDNHGLPYNDVQSSKIDPESYPTAAIFFLVIIILSAFISLMLRRKKIFFLSNNNEQKSVLRLHSLSDFGAYDPKYKSDIDLRLKKPLAKIRESGNDIV